MNKQAIFDRIRLGPPFTEDEVRDIISVVGEMPGSKLSEMDNWDDSVLEKYADYIRNYEYTYKPEATNIDKSIDPNEVQIGPMAQDIEKVNPSCIVEINGGVKTVDIKKLALMNAGAIADCARRIKQIEEYLEEVE